MTPPLHITMAQLNPTVGAVARNAARVRDVIEEETAAEAVIIFPEMVLCGYPPEDLILKPSFMQRIRAEAGKLAAESAQHGHTLILPVPWEDEDTNSRYNAALVIARGKIEAVTKKHHLPNYGVFDERRHFKAAHLPSPVDIAGHKIGIMICEDMWLPNVAGRLRDEGAELLICVNASPFESGKPQKRIRIAQSRVSETGLPLLYVNQVGGQDELVFDGGSFILGERGDVLSQCPLFAESRHRSVWQRTGGDQEWLCDSSTPSVSLPDETEAVYGAVMLGLRDYVTKNGFSGVLLGLSGGVDSALTAAFAVDALGADAVHAVMMPSRYTSQDSLDDAEALANNLGITLESIEIDPVTDALESQIAAHLNENTPGETLENLQSRARGTILMALSNATGHMLLSTGNKSEMAVGYATLYGDMNGGFNPLKDLYKTQVYELCRWRNAHKPAHTLGPEQGEIIPQRVITKAPSAELRPDQTDQDSLPPYDELDAILRSLIEDDKGLAELVADGHDEDTARRVWQMLDRAEYKRRQAPPGVKITSRAFGRDRRYPITNGFRE